jgi:hypothetical protein
MGAERPELAKLRLSSDHCVRLPNGPTLISVPFKALIGNFCPKLFQPRRCCFVGMPFRIFRYAA